MKRLLLIVLPLLLSVGLSQQEYDLNSIEEKNGVYYKKYSEEIVNGKVFEMFGDVKVPLGKMKDGKLDGLWTDWYENGKKNIEENYKDGELDGLKTWWYRNGQKRKEGNYKDGKPDGLWTWWYKNGKKKSEKTYKDGEENSS